jgi:iron complex transport system substrate-binding protein
MIVVKNVLKRYILSAHIVLMVLLLSACGGKSKTSFLQEQGDTLRLHYAENLQIVKYDRYTKVTLRNPWDTLQILHTYLLVDKKDTTAMSLPEGTVIQVPLTRALVYSSVHCGLLQELGALDKVKGVCDLQYMRIPAVLEGCRNGSVTDAGSSMNPDIEKVIDMHPDAILLSPYQNSGGYGRIEKLNVPILECADYMETSALGRAEWVRFYGLLFGKEQEADSLFAEVERKYLSLRNRVKDISPKPIVITELKTGGTWYVPGGNSTMAKVYADAGARYIFSDIPQSGSASLAFEAVFDRGQHADFWLIKYNQQTDKTYRELKNDYAPYANFDAFRNRRVYGCNTSRISFYEEVPFHPELLLEDLVKVFHPEVLKDYAPRYFTNLAE